MTRCTSSCCRGHLPALEAIRPRRGTKRTLAVLMLLVIVLPALFYGL